MSMDIYSEEGTKVKFVHPNAGYDCHIETAKQYLTLNEIYTVVKTEVSGWHTDVYLKEVPNVAFNSVMFDEVEETELVD